MLQPSKKTALIIVDMQNDFMDGGILPVPGALALVPEINKLMYHHDIIVLTQDYHPTKHCSFASSHGVAPFVRHECTEPETKHTHTLFPDHCVKGSVGAEFVDGLNVFEAHMIIRKGTNVHRDSPSAFRETEGEFTGLHGYLHSVGVESVTVCGVALDVCVYATILDALTFGFKVNVFKSTVAPVIPESAPEIYSKCIAKGVVVEDTVLSAK